MSLTAVGLTIKTTISEGCTKLTVEDITGNYNAITNPLGYGLPNGIAYNDITSIIINVYYPDITTPITYTFTLSSGTVTALTVTDLNGVVYNIFADLADLYVDGVFNLTGTDAFTLPVITDGLFSVDFTESGIESVTEEEFNYTTSKNFLSTCNTECCITDMYKNLDMCCDCKEDKIENIELAELMLSGAKKAVAIGQDEKAVCLLNKAKEVCDGNCDNC